MKPKLHPWKNGSPHWCNYTPSLKNLQKCWNCEHLEIWGELEEIPDTMDTLDCERMRCKLDLYQDHTGKSQPSPCLYLSSADCLVNCPSLFDFGILEEKK